jgi:hypothetical protein
MMIALGPLIRCVAVLAALTLPPVEGTLSPRLLLPEEQTFLLVTLLRVVNHRAWYKTEERCAKECKGWYERNGERIKSTHASIVQIRRNGVWQRPPYHQGQRLENRQKGDGPYHLTHS